MRSVRSRGWWSLFKRLQVKVNIVREQCLHYMENMHCISLSICIVASIMLRPYFNHAEIIFNLQKLQIFFLNILKKNHYENILSRTKQIITADMITDIPKFILQQSFFVYLFVSFPPQSRSVVLYD